VERLRSAGMLSCLQLLHFHLGSQIANIRDVQRGMLEACRCFAELAELGVNVRVMDVGGGWVWTTKARVRAVHVP